VAHRSHHALPMQHDPELGFWFAFIAMQFVVSVIGTASGVPK
jgi:hypothetical protein